MKIQNSRRWWREDARVTVVVVLDDVPCECVRAIVPFVPTCWPVLDDDCVVQDWDEDGDPTETIRY